jgi:hypothetical protein
MENRGSNKGFPIDAGVEDASMARQFAVPQITDFVTRNDSGGAAAGVFPEPGFSRESLSPKRLTDRVSPSTLQKRGICNGLPVLASVKEAGLQFHSIGTTEPIWGIHAPL